MFLTNILLKKAKSKRLLVLVSSMISGHKRFCVRERVADKLEFICFDPLIQQQALYKEMRKIRSLS